MRHIATILLVSALTAPLFAQDGTLSNADRKFVRTAAEDSIAEISAAKLVDARTNNPAVKNACERMIMDHTQALDQIRELAQNHNITLPTSPNAHHKAFLRKLRLDSVFQMNRDFTNDQVKGHKEDIANFRKEARDGSALDVRDWASETVPTLRNHEDIWQRVQEKLEH